MWTLLLFAGIIVGSSAAGAGRCPQLTTVQNFDVAQYLGRWYEIEAYGNIFERLAVTCPKADYSLNETTGEVIVRNSGKSRLNGGETVFSGTATPVGDGKLSVTFRFPLGLSNTAPYWVLGTDYKTWAVVWSCSDTPLFYTDFSWILTRERNPTNTDFNTQINEVLARNNIQRGKYVKIEQTNC